MVSGTINLYLNKVINLNGCAVNIFESQYIRISTKLEVKLIIMKVNSVLETIETLLMLK